MPRAKFRADLLKTVAMQKKYFNGDASFCQITSNTTVITLVIIVVINARIKKTLSQRNATWALYKISLTITCLHRCSPSCHLCQSWYTMPQTVTHRKLLNPLHLVKPPTYVIQKVPLFLYPQYI